MDDVTREDDLSENEQKVMFAVCHCCGPLSDNDLVTATKLSMLEVCEATMSLMSRGFLSLFVDPDVTLH